VPVLILQNTHPDFGRGFRASGRKFQTGTSSTATLFGSTHKYMSASQLNRINTMTNKCILCDAIVHPLRIQAGIYTCIHCGDKLAKQRTHCIVPMHKSNYIVVTDRDDLVRINNKSG